MSPHRATLSIVAVLDAHRRRVGDLAIAAVSLVAAVTGTGFEIAGTDGPFPPSVLGYGMAALATVPLVWRYRTPLLVSTAGVLICVGYHVVGYPGLAPAVALFAGVYAITSQGVGWRSIAAAAVVVLALSAVPLLPPRPAAFGWAILGPAVALTATAALGEAARARRVAVEEQMRAVRRSADERARRSFDQERLDIAREVHDVLAHTITVIAVQAAAAAEALDRNPEETRTALGTVRGAAKEALAELRGTLLLMRDGAGPDPLAPQPTLAQLPELADRARAAGLAATLSVRGNPDSVAAAVQSAVYRIVQEALTNTIRHAVTASSVRITVTVGRETVSVEVTDDGTAADASAIPGTIPNTTPGTIPNTTPGTIPNTAPGPAHGLVGMRERVHALGGTLEAGVAASPAAGFRIAARLPTTANLE